MHGCRYRGGAEINATEKQDHSCHHVRMERLRYSLECTDTYGFIIDLDREVVGSEACFEAKVHFGGFKGIDIDGSMIDGSEQRNSVFLEPLCPRRGREQRFTPFQGSMNGVNSGLRYLRRYAKHSKRGFLIHRFRG